MTADRVPIAVTAEGPGAGIDAWLDLLGRVARHYRLPLSEQRARLAAHWELGADDEARVRTLARATGLGVQFVPAAGMRLTSWRLPLIVRLRDGEIALIEGIDAEGRARLIVPGDRGGATHLPID